jgi:hypothetical protein
VERFLRSREGPRLFPHLFLPHSHLQPDVPAEEKERITDRGKERMGSDLKIELLTPAGIFGP